MKSRLDILSDLYVTRYYYEVTIPRMIRDALFDERILAMTKKQFPIIPLYDKVIIKRANTEQTGRLVIPAQYLEKEDRGTVIAVGCGRFTNDGNLVPLRVKVGDVVLFGKYAAAPFKFDGEEYLQVPEAELTGIIVEGE